MLRTVRGFSSTTVAALPRKPSAPRVQFSAPSSADLAAPPVKPLQYRPPMFRKTQPAGIRFSRPPAPQRHITDTDTAIPLPTTYPTGIKTPSQLRRSRVPAEKLDTSLNPYPYRYYEISLTRSLTGLPKKVRAVVHALGLYKRHQVVWSKVGPRSAGQILQIRELLDVKLVNDIPEKATLPLGFNKIGTSIGSF
ncbi:hypothetical protein DFS34DRAFT_609493 [Phlyctochytrium arcticum]|nr:hypothetical protein DFS34DRAFT_609493 [Phlyctochytrium arcticum]